MKTKVIRDSMITDEIFDKLIGKVYVELADKDITQMNIYNVLHPLKISNTTIAKVINILIPDARATSNSIQSLLTSKKKQRSNPMIDELLSELDKEL